MILNRDRFAILSDIWGRFRSLSLISPVTPAVGPGDDGFLWIDIGVEGTPAAPLWKMWDEAAATWRLIGGGTGAVDWDDVTGKPATFPPETHTHSKLVASDGDPDPALSADDSGDLTFARHLKLDDGAGIQWDTQGQIFTEASGFLTYDTLVMKAAYVMRMEVDGVTRSAYSGSGWSLEHGVAVNEFSSDDTLGDDSDTAVPTEKAVKTYVDGKASGLITTAHTHSKLVASDGSPSDAVQTNAAGKLTANYGLDITGDATITGLLTMSGGDIQLGDSQLRGTTRDLADDAATSFTPGEAIGYLTVYPRHSGSTAVYAIVAYRTSATAFTTAIVASSSVNVTTGVLTGTTGTDGKFTISAHTDGKIYLENRLGGTRYFGTQVMGG